ncbi:cuticle protein AMP1A-like [Cherax quadricarinatus]|uniref:cuticle protein AMP1A-like n=1 Tax=Cherax quadricarinatus TaxID=27406 RepID=UPI00387E9E94
MKFVILAVLACMALATPKYNAPEPQSTLSASEIEANNQALILKDERVREDDGRYNVEVETGNGIILSQSGSPEGETKAISAAGQYSYTAPDGSLVKMKYVANANGYQPESDFLPVAPEFPHPVPLFVLRQIAFAAEEDAARARSESNGPSLTYTSPQ